MSWPAPVPLLRTLEAAIRDTSDPKVRVRVSAVQDLGRLSLQQSATRVGSCLAEVLRGDPVEQVRAEAAQAFASPELSAFAPRLVEALSDPAPRVRQMALLALSEMGAQGPPVVEAVAPFCDDLLPGLRFQGLLALARLAPHDAEPRLLAAVEDPDAEVVYLALRLLDERWSEQGGPEPGAARGAARCLLDASPRLRLAAALALYRVLPEQAAGVIAEVLNSTWRIRDPEDEQRAIELVSELSILSAMEGLRRRAFPAWWARSSAFGWHARTGLARLGDVHAKRAILAGLRAWSRHTRTLAVVAAGLALMVEAEGPLQEMLSGGSSIDRGVVESALEAIQARKQGE